MESKSKRSESTLELKAILRIGSCRIDLSTLTRLETSLVSFAFDSSGERSLPMYVERETTSEIDSRLTKSDKGGKKSVLGRVKDRDCRKVIEERRSTGSTSGLGRSVMTRRRR